MRIGHIYILENKIFKNNLLKIGKTRKEPTERAKGLSSKTNMPSEFTINYTRLFFNVDYAENAIFRKLKEYRYNTRREFFTCTIEHARKIVNEVAITDLEKELSRLKTLSFSKEMKIDNDLKEHLKIKKKWINFFDNIGWEYKLELNTKKYKPDFILQTKDYYEDPFTSEGDKKYKKRNTLVYINPNVQFEDGLLNLNTDERIREVIDHFKDNKAGNYLVIIGESPQIDSTNCIFGWKLFGENFEELKFVKHIDGSIPTLGLWDDDSTWSCMIKGVLIGRENLYPQKEEIMNFWN